jgi:uncharacterized membrane protein YeaQ/YmgE (transglycosylase-associated protein family)
MLYIILKYNHTKEAILSFISWIILGFATGLVASKIVKRTGEGFTLDIPLGIVGAKTSGGNKYEKIKRKVSTNKTNKFS